MLHKLQFLGIEIDEENFSFCFCLREITCLMLSTNSCQIKMERNMFADRVFKCEWIFSVKLYMVEDTIAENVDKDKADHDVLLQ